MTDTVCVVMAKQPLVGRTKTRLSPPLTLEQAAALYKALLRDVIFLVASQPGIELAVAISPLDSHPFFTKITPPGTLLLPIEDTDIGICLSQVFRTLLGTGWRKVIALNADSPSLPPAYLQQSVKLLDVHDVVLGPALDGGYYLVGMQRPYLGIFRDVLWSTAQVLTQTLERATTLKLDVGLTPEWYDVDTADDLVRLQKDLDGLPADHLVHTRQFFVGFGKLAFGR